MDEFERGVRFVIERIETYKRESGHQTTQFGDYQLSMRERGPDEKLLPKSAAHQERRVQAILHCARLSSARSDRSDEAGA